MNRLPDTTAGERYNQYNSQRVHKCTSKPSIVVSSTGANSPALLQARLLGFAISQYWGLYPGSTYTALSHRTGVAAPSRSGLGARSSCKQAIIGRATAILNLCDGRTRCTQWRRNTVTQGRTSIVHQNVDGLIMPTHFACKIKN